MNSGCQFDILTFLKFSQLKVGIAFGGRSGHAPQNMDDRYNKIDEGDKLEAMGKLEGYRASVDHSVDQAQPAK